MTSTEMDSGATPTVELVPVDAARGRLRLPSVLEVVVMGFEQTGWIDETELERGLVESLHLDQVMWVWVDCTHRRAWSPRGPVSFRAQELAITAAAIGQRLVLDDAIVEPLGRAPARASLVFEGAPDQLFAPHVHRTIRRIAQRLAR